MNTLPAIHDTAIRLNALAEAPARVGKPVDGTPEHRAFLKAFGDALAVSGPAFILAQVAASLGSLPKAETFMKSMVKDWDAENRHKLAHHEIKGAFAGPHESFPVASPEDLKHAFMLAGHAADPDAVRSRLHAIAKERGWEEHVPDADKDGDNEEGMKRSLKKAMAICDTMRSFAKAQVGGYTRTHNGKLVQVHAYTSKRNASMGATQAAYDASKKAMTTREGADHVAAMNAHLEALRHHTEAHESSPADVAKDHADLMDHHRAAARWHADKAKGDTGTYGPKAGEVSVSAQEKK